MSAIQIWSRGLIDARRGKERPLIGLSLRWWDSYTHTDADWKIHLSLGGNGLVQKFTQDFQAADLYDVMHLTTKFLEKTP